MRIGEKMSKGIFWFPCFMGTEGELIFTEEIEALLIPCDEDGNSKVSVSFYTCEYNSRNGRSNTHKDSWKAVTAGRKDLRGIPWNYFPRGRVEISHGRAFLYMNPEILKCNNYLERIREKFGIGHLDIRVRIDNSAHYQCTILENKEKKGRASVGQGGYKTKDRKAFGSKRKYK